MREIETFTTDELWNELKNRYNSCVLVYEKDVIGKQDELITNNLCFSGSYAICLGLLMYGQKYVEFLIDSCFEMTCDD